MNKGPGAASRLLWGPENLFINKGPGTAVRVLWSRQVHEGLTAYPPSTGSNWVDSVIRPSLADPVRPWLGGPSYLLTGQEINGISYRPKELIYVASLKSIYIFPCWPGKACTKHVLQYLLFLQVWQYYVRIAKLMFGRFFVWPPIDLTLFGLAHKRVFQACCSTGFSFLQVL